MMTIVDADLRQHVERVCALGMGTSPQQQFVMALLDAWWVFYHLHGEETLAVRECVNILVSVELRPAVRQWYQDCDAHGMNPAAAAFRARLSQIAGETL